MTNKYNQEEYLIKNGERFTILTKNQPEKEIPHEDRCDPENREFGRKITMEVVGLNLKNPEDRKIYDEKLEEFIKISEDSRKEVYLDSAKLKTVGIGHNMDKTDKFGKNTSRPEWNNQIFGEEYCKTHGKKGPDFDEVYKGNRILTKDEISTLFLFDVKDAEKRIKGIYGEKVWNASSPAERLLLTDMAFGGNKLIGKHNKKGEPTEFYKHFMSYIQDRNICSFSGIHWEIIARSNPDKGKKVGGVQRRNCRRIGVLEVIKEHLNLNHKSLPEYVIPGKTYIPRNMTGKPSKDSEYFIWRTMLDNRVRDDCSKKEGKLYRNDDSKNQPKSDYGCRCEKECLTEEVAKRINDKAHYFEGEANANIKQAPQFGLKGEVVLITSPDHDIMLLKSQINLSHYSLISDEMGTMHDEIDKKVRIRKFQVIEPRGPDFIIKISPEKFRIHC